MGAVGSPLIGHSPWDGQRHARSQGRGAGGPTRALGLSKLLLNRSFETSISESLDLEGAYHLAERVREGIESLALPLPDNQGTLRVTASLGVASLPRGAGDPRDLLARADAALYEAKRSGKNKVCRAG